MIMEWLVGLYLNILNVIYYMYDKYSYECIEMVFYDINVFCIMVIGIVGLFVVVDLLSVIKYVKVKLICDENGIVVDFEIEGDFFKYGNNDDCVDEIVVNFVKIFMNKFCKYIIYRNFVYIMLILIIIFNVVYGKKIGNILDGCCIGELFVLGVNLMYGCDIKGVLVLLLFVVKLLYEDV